MTTTHTKTALESWRITELKNLLKEMDLPVNGNKTELVTRVLREQERIARVDATISNIPADEQKEDQVEQVTISKAQYDELVRQSQAAQPTINSRIDEDGDGEAEETQRITDYLRIQADNNQDSSEKHHTSILRDLKKGW